MDAFFRKVKQFQLKSAAKEEARRTTLKIIRLPSIADLPIPAYQTDGAAGIDLHAAEKRWIASSVVAKIPTGIRIQIPAGYVGLVLGRSGRSAKGQWVSTGVIDCDFIGEIQVIVTHVSGLGEWVERGDRIAQLVIVPVARMNIVEVTELTETKRGSGGFGSTGG